MAVEMSTVRFTVGSCSGNTENMNPDSEISVFAGRISLYTQNAVQVTVSEGTMSNYSAFSAAVGYPVTFTASTEALPLWYEYPVIVRNKNTREVLATLNAGESFSVTDRSIWYDAQFTNILDYHTVHIDAVAFYGTAAKIRYTTFNHQQVEIDALRADDDGNVDYPNDPFFSDDGWGSYIHDDTHLADTRYPITYVVSASESTDDITDIFRMNGAYIEAGVEYSVDASGMTDELRLYSDVLVKNSITFIPTQNVSCKVKYTDPYGEQKEETISGSEKRIEIDSSIQDVSLRDFFTTANDIGYPIYVSVKDNGLDGYQMSTDCGNPNAGDSEIYIVDIGYSPPDAFRKAPQNRTMYIKGTKVHSFYVSVSEGFSSPQFRFDYKGDTLGYAHVVDLSTTPVLVTGSMSQQMDYHIHYSNLDIPYGTPVSCTAFDNAGNVIGSYTANYTGDVYFPKEFLAAELYKIVFTATQLQSFQVYLTAGEGIRQWRPRINGKAQDSIYNGEQRIFEVTEQTEVEVYSALLLRGYKNPKSVSSVTQNGEIIDTVIENAGMYSKLPVSAQNNAFVLSAEKDDSTGYQLRIVRGEGCKSVTIGFPNDNVLVSKSAQTVTATVGDVITITAEPVDGYSKSFSVTVSYKEDGKTRYELLPDGGGKAVLEYVPNIETLIVKFLIQTIPQTIVNVNMEAGKPGYGAPGGKGGRGGSGCIIVYHN